MLRKFKRRLWRDMKKGSTTKPTSDGIEIAKVFGWQIPIKEKPTSKGTKGGK